MKAKAFRLNFIPHLQRKIFEPSGSFFKTDPLRG